MTSDSKPQVEHELVVTRLIDAPREKLFRCWTEPALLQQWFCPKPWYVADSVIDLRSGGQFDCTMCGPDGERFLNQGLILEVMAPEKLVFTDLMMKGWRPTASGMFTAVVTFADLPGGGTHYTALAMHRTLADRDRHAEMGFESGWGAAAVQLDDLALSLG